MKKRVIHTEHAPAAVGPYSQAIVVGDFVFTSGQIALVPATGTMVEGDVAAQAEQVLQNLGSVLTAAGSSLEGVIKTTIFLKSMKDFATVNEVYGRYFPHKPARSTVAVAALPLGALVEIEAVALMVKVPKAPKAPKDPKAPKEPKAPKDPKASKQSKASKDDPKGKATKGKAKEGKKKPSKVKAKQRRKS